jgi:hypothetical protein
MASFRLFSSSSLFLCSLSFLFLSISILLCCSSLRGYPVYLLNSTSRGFNSSSFRSHLRNFSFSLSYTEAISVTLDFILPILERPERELRLIFVSRAFLLAWGFRKFETSENSDSKLL